MPPRPSPAVSNRLLADLLCNAVAMRAAEHSTLVHGLVNLQEGPVSRASIRSLRSAVLSPKADYGEDDDDDEDVMPWDEPIYAVENGVALVNVCGTVVKGYDACTCWYFGLMSIDRLQLAIDEIAQREDVAAVVFWINSPGGMAAGMPETADAIVDLGTSKLTLAFTSDTACSAGYSIAAACSKIFCTRSAVLGSIGTYLAFYDYTEMLTEAGIKLELFVRGKYKAIGVDGNPLSDDQRAFLDEWIGRINDLFTSFVSSRRPGVTSETMQGQWFDGEQAVALKLADAVISGLPELLGNLRMIIQPATAAFI
jgi:signal peptide peptidase SppA